MKVGKCNRNVALCHWHKCSSPSSRKQPQFQTEYCLHLNLYEPALYHTYQYAETVAWNTNCTYGTPVHKGCTVVPYCFYVAYLGIRRNKRVRESTRIERACFKFFPPGICKAITMTNRTQIHKKSLCCTVCPAISPIQYFFYTFA